MAREARVPQYMRDTDAALCALARFAALAQLDSRQGWIPVPREPSEAMLRAALDARYQRSKRNQRVKAMFPEAYETWIRHGMKEDARAMAEEYKAMISAAPPQQEDR